MRPTVSLGASIALSCAFGVTPIGAFAGSRPQVDLSVSVTTTPEPFMPGGIATVTMTVRNAGPEAAGSTLSDMREIVVLEKPYSVVEQSPPFLLFEPALGCSAYSELSEYIPGLPGGGITLLNSYYFDNIAPGEARTCVYRVQFLASTQESFATYWRVIDSANDDDINPANDRFDYTFVAAAPQPAKPVPASSPIALLILSAALVLTRALASCVRPSR